MNAVIRPGGPDRRAVLKGGAALAAGAGTWPLFVRRAHAITPGHIVFGLSSYPPSLHPWKNVGTAALTVKYQMFRGLLAYDATGALRSELAENWEAEDAQTYRFDLRQNATFHDGSPVTSADVKATFDAIMAEDSVGYLRVALGIVDTIETPDKHTIRFRLNEPSATFIYLAASPYALVVSQASLGGEPENYVGAGPFRISNVERGTRVDLEAYEGFYKKGLPRSQTLSFVAYKDENLRVAAIEAGDVDIIEYVPWQSMDAVERNENLVLDTTSGPFMYIMFNTMKDGPLANPMVRDAIGFAIRREDVMAAAFFGRGSALRGMPIPASSPFFNEELANHWDYDPDRARALLSEAGYPDGFQASLLSTGQYNMHKDTAEVCQQHLAAVGIAVELNLPDWPTRIDLGNQGQYDMAVMGSGGEYNDPDALANFIDGRRGNTYGRSFGFSDDVLNDLLDQGRAEVKFEKRKEIYDAMQRRALEVVPLVGINWRAQGYATQAAISGFKGLPGFLTFYSGLMIEEAMAS